jgi:integrase
MNIMINNELLDKMLASKAIKQNTKDIYKAKLDVVTTEIFPNHTLMYILMHPKEFEKRLRHWGMIHNMGDHGINGYFSAVMSLFHHNQDFRDKHWEIFKEWEDIHRQIRRPIEEHYLSNEPTPRQAAAYMPFDEVKRVMERMEEGTAEKLLLAMYVYIPPLRSDYASTKIYHVRPKNKPADENYIILDENPQVVVQMHKTDDKYKEIVNAIPPQLEREIRASLKKSPREYLFVSTRSGKSYSTMKSGDRAWNAWANSVLRKHLNDQFTLTMFRHIWLTRSDLDLCNKTGTELNELAERMGHSVSQQRKYIFMRGLE